MSEAFLSPELFEKISHKLFDQKHKPGLYVVATPIGNMLDITLRAIYILKKAKYVFAEDTRQAKKLFNFYGINTQLIPCHEHNEISNQVVSAIKKDEIYALISDAGTPLISDPGYRLVNWCICNSIDVFPVPGACSFVAALSASGFSAENFSFHGFLPSKSNARREILKKIEGLTSTLIFFEAPHRIVKSLIDMKECFGNRYCCVCREITKIFEEFKRGRIEEFVEYFSAHKPIGEFVIIVSGKDESTIIKVEEYAKDMSEDLKEHMKDESLNDAVRKISKKYQISKNIIYQEALKIKKGSP